MTNRSVLTRRQALSVGGTFLALAGAGGAVGTLINPAGSSGETARAGGGESASTSSGSATTPTPAGASAASSGPSAPSAMPDLIGEGIERADALPVHPRIRFVERRGAIRVKAQTPKAGTTLAPGTVPTLTAGGHLVTQDASTALRLTDGVLRLDGTSRLPMPPRSARLQMTLSCDDGTSHAILLRTSHGGPAMRRNVTRSATRLTLAVDNAEWIELELVDGSRADLTVEHPELTKAS